MSEIKKNLIVVLSIGIISVILSFLIVKTFPPLPVVSDSKDYHDIAIGIIEQKTYITISNDKILYPPLYPVFLSIIYSIGLGISGVYIIQYILVGIIAICVFYILRKYFKLPILIALVAPLTVLFWPYFILYSQLISSEILYSFLLMMFFTFFIHINQNTKPTHILATGVFIGLAVLTRPVALLLLPWIFIALWLFKKMPSFFGYMAWSAAILLPLFLLITLIFFR